MEDVLVKLVCRKRRVRFELYTIVSREDAVSGGVPHRCKAAYLVVVIVSHIDIVAGIGSTARDKPARSGFVCCV